MEGGPAKKAPTDKCGNRVKMIVATTTGPAKGNAATLRRQPVCAMSRRRLPLTIIDFFFSPIFRSNETDGATWRRTEQRKVIFANPYTAIEARFRLPLGQQNSAT